MKILEDGRWALSQVEIQNKVWERVKTWRLCADGKHMEPDFPVCPARSLINLCLPCGKQTRFNYHCSEKDSLVGVSHCKGCEIRDGLVAATVEDTPVSDPVQVHTGETDILGTEPKDTGDG